jgi:hypothetical protein
VNVPDRDRLFDAQINLQARLQPRYALQRQRMRSKMKTSSPAVNL